MKNKDFKYTETKRVMEVADFVFKSKSNGIYTVEKDSFGVIKLIYMSSHDVLKFLLTHTKVAVLYSNGYGGYMNWDFEEENE